MARRALAAATLGSGVAFLDGTIVNVALPSIRRDLGFSAVDLQWVVNAYTLTFSGFLLLDARAADLLGRHVADAAQHRAGLRQLVEALALDRRDAEVHQLRHAVLQHADVARLDVPV